MLKQLCCTLVFSLPALAIAGGPLVLEGPNGRTPATYQSPDIVLNFDLGPLGLRNNDTADQVVNDARAVWNDITTSTVNLSQGVDMPVDVDHINFTSYIPVPGSSTIHNDDDGLNPIVYDDDGLIIDAFFGAGQGSAPDSTVVGFAASSIFIGSNFFTEGFAVINGNSNLGVGPTELRLIVAHELGHFIGLDHSQADIDNTEVLIPDPLSPNPPSCLTAPPGDYPLMYPYACRDTRVTHPDDDVAVSTLYPAADFFQNQGQLKGTLVTTAGAPVRGANLWVENTQTGQVYSIVSDYLTQCTGFFALMLPPGNYILHANSINPEFFGGSSVGPYAITPIDVSFQPPASVIGRDLLFRADGTQPAIITLEAGKSVDILFRTDGSGTVTPSDAQVALSEIYNSESACVAGGGGGGGSPGLPLLAALLLIPALRIRV